MPEYRISVSRIWLLRNEAYVPEIAASYPTTTTVIHKCLEYQPNRAQLEVYFQNFINSLSLRYNIRARCREIMPDL